jgi:tight adherence protein B
MKKFLKGSRMGIAALRGRFMSARPKGEGAGVGAGRLRFYAVCVPAMALIGFLFYDNVLIALGMALLSVFAEGIYERVLSERRRRRLVFEFRELLLSLSTSFSTGRHMREALLDAYAYLSGSLLEDSPMLEELKQMCKRLEYGGESERDVLVDLAEVSQSEDIGSFVDVYLACVDTGGDIIRAVSRSAEALIDKISIEKEVETLTAQKKLESVILGVTPLLIIGFLKLSSPEYIAPLYDTAAGMILMTGALGILAASVVWSERILKFED